MKLLTLVFALILGLNSMSSALSSPQDDLPELHQKIIEGNFEEVKKLIGDGADINELDRKMGNSPLHIAAQTDHHEIVRHLIEKGAFVNLQTPRSGFTPLMVAVWYSKVDNILELMKAKDLNIHIKTPGGVAAEQWIGGFDTDLDDNEKALIKSIKEVFKSYRTQQQRNIEDQKIITTLLSTKLNREQKTEMVTEFIEAGADVNAVQPVIGNGNDAHSALLIASRMGYSEIVGKLLDAGADQSHKGYMMDAVALHKAAYKGHADVLEFLLRDPSSKKVLNAMGPNNGYTPLHDAVWHGNLEASRVLIQAGARQDLRNYEGDTPLDLAKRYGYREIAELLE